MPKLASSLFLSLSLGLAFGHTIIPGNNRVVAVAQQSSVARIKQSIDRARLEREFHPARQHQTGGRFARQAVPRGGGEPPN